MPSEAFEAQTALLMRAPPYVAAETCFALKADTAINVPGLSVTRLCLGLEPNAIPIGESVEYLFEEAQRNHEPDPMKRLADKLRLGSKNI
jgi:hypothetical protein